MAVITGYSNPLYYVLGGSGNAVTPLARGVNASISVEGGTATNWYADNGIAETVAGGFTSGTLSLECDCLSETARTALLGVGAASNDWQSFTKNDTAPYVAIGFIVRVVQSGTTSYVPFICTKCLFKPESLSAATQEADIAFQTQTLEAALSVNTAGVWKMVGAGQSTEGTAPSGETAGTGALGKLYTAMATLAI